MPACRKLIFLNTHPIQYFSPLYKQIEDSRNFDLEVWYCTHHGLAGEVDREFNTSVKWDTPVLEGYQYRFFKNVSWKPGIFNGFWGVVNPGIFIALRKLPSKSIIVVNAWNPFSTVFTIICSKILGHHTCLRAEPPLVHEYVRSKFSLLSRKLLLKNLLFRFIDTFLYIGTQNKKFYEYYGVNPRKLVFSPYSVDNKYFTQQAGELLPHKAEIERTLGIPEDKKIILFSGKLISKKRPLDLLKAYQKIAAVDKYVLIFMGDGELRTLLENYTTKNNIPNVLITGFINQSAVSKFYSIADVFVMCSDVGETWGLSTNEAMNFGLPVIISDRTGNHEDLVKGNGYIVPTGDTDILSIKLLDLLSDSKEEWSRKSECSKKLVSKFSYDIVVENLRLIK